MPIGGSLGSINGNINIAININYVSSAVQSRTGPMIPNSECADTQSKTGSSGSK